MALQYLVDGSYGVLAGSIGGASLGLLQAALEQRAETKKIERSVTSSVAYLSQVAAL